LAALKIENLTGRTLPRNTLPAIDKILSYVPKEHLRGIEKLKLVGTISDPRLPETQRSTLPGLYHPRQLNQSAWIEVAIETLLPRNGSLFKRIAPRLSFKGNLAAVLYSLVGQHYHFTMRHSVKKNRLEGAVRAYTEGLLKQWGEGEHQLRARIFKPLRPFFEKWAKDLKKKESAARKKS
jgi:hypothetical protein